MKSFFDINELEVRLGGAWRTCLSRSEDATLRWADPLVWAYFDELLHLLHLRHTVCANGSSTRKVRDLH
jgi:hypothetical protein